ncbi:hypothetical protein Micbo1qcDRAFT_204081 [Microdochium bolleyi]|uniref:F-box domain-containing protein n=1 Tax=Microdochium bolleyi TaxID=196109 RepID=A0A136J4A2_9PEZI|nr:hypothetical protein Micbo1qcDRAFT_204081 [Microdochium bolleyi]
METSSIPAHTGSTQLSGSSSVPTTGPPPSQTSHSLPIVEDDESEWEYEYSATETEVCIFTDTQWRTSQLTASQTFYVTLDLSTQDFTDKRTKTIHHGRGGYQGEKQADLFQSRHQSPDASGAPSVSRRDSTAVASDDGESKHPQAPSHDPQDARLRGLEARGWSGNGAGGDDVEDDDEEENLDEVQIMELHSANPVISYHGRVYAAQWHQNIGTEFLLTRRDEDDSNHHGLPVLRQLDNGVDLLAASSARLSVTQKELKRKDTSNNDNIQQQGPSRQASGAHISGGGAAGDQEEGEENDEIDSLVPPADSGASQARIDQGDFLRQFIALKRSRGETDDVPVLTSADHLPKRAPSKRTTGRGRGQGAGGGRPRGTPRGPRRGRGGGAGVGRTRTLLNIAAQVDGRSSTTPDAAAAKNDDGEGQANATICQFCGVSFGVGRIRTADEPRGAGWSQAGGWTRDQRGYIAGGSEPRYENCIQLKGKASRAPPDTREGRRAFYVKSAEEVGCRLVQHELPLWGPGSELRYRDREVGVLVDGDEDDDDDSSYDPGNDSADEDPFEYDSEPDSADVDAYEARMEEASAASQDEPVWTFSVEGPSPLAVMDTKFKFLSSCWDPEPPYDQGSEEDECDHNVASTVDRPYRFYEHIAGPDCSNDHGYNGHLISVDEMFHGHTAQFLASKILLEESGSAWESAEDDLDFERDSACFLTGLSKAAPVTDDTIRVQPERHGVDQIESDNYLYEWMTIHEYGLPFHPTCFELFCQASRVAFNGRVDINGLMELRDTTCREPGSRPVTGAWPAAWNKDTERSYWQGWSCFNGCEYLVANPVYVPRLTAIIASSTAASRQGSGFSIQDSPFAYREPALPPTAGGDPFLKLPVEVGRCIVDYLGSKDIASLRLASHAFQQLPISLWHRLVMEEMPFLYEAWSDDVQPYPWASRLASDWEKYAKTKADLDTDRMHRRQVVKEDMPEALDDWIENEVVLDDADIESQTMCADRRRILEYTPVKLQLKTTNWYQLYRDIVVSWDHLKGLRNRERIWQHVTDITEAIGQMKPVVGGDVEMSM